MRFLSASDDEVGGLKSAIRAERAPASEAILTVGDVALQLIALKLDLRDV
jgi:hypothetical protein